VAGSHVLYRVHAILVINAKDIGFQWMILGEDARKDDEIFLSCKEYFCSC